MLDVSPTNLLMELQAADRIRDLQLESFQDMVDHYTGPYSHARDKDAWPENHFYEYCTLMLPKVIYDNPRTKITSRRATPEEAIQRIDERMQMLAEAMQMGMADPGQTQMMMMQLRALRMKLSAHNLMAKAMQHGENRWIVQNNARNKLLEVATDMFFGHGVLLTRRTRIPGSRSDSSDPYYWPEWCRISPKRFGFDPLCLRYNGARYAYHVETADKDDLLKRAKEDPESGWDAKVIDGLAERSGEEALHRTGELEDVPARRELAFYEVWVPEYELPDSLGPDQGFHGTLFTVAVTPSGAEEEGSFIRKPRPYFGPRTGPYTMFGVYPVPDSPWRLAPLAAVCHQTAELNAHSTANSESAKNYKRGVITDPKIAAAVRDMPHDCVFGYQGYEKGMIDTFEVGGVTDSMLRHEASARDRLDRGSGISDTQRGNVQSDVTATAEAIASESGVLRSAFVRQQFADGATDALEKVSFYLYHDDESVFALGPEAAEDMGMIEPVFHGGSHAEGDDSTWDDLELNIDIHSMEHVSDALMQSNTQRFMEWIAQTVPLMAETPFFDWKTTWNDAGDSFNKPKMGDLINKRVLQQMAQIEIASKNTNDPMQSKAAGQSDEKSNTLGQREKTGGEQQGNKLGQKQSSNRSPAQKRSGGK